MPTSNPPQPTRRDWLRKTLNVSAAAASGIAAASASGPAVAGLFGGNFRIDVHCHLVPDFYRQVLADHGITSAGGLPLPAWSPQAAVGFMNRFNIQSQVVSVSEPGVYFLPTAAARLQLARRLNDYMRDELVGASGASPLGGRFGAFGVLPLGNVADPVDVSNACAEAVRAVTQLELDGIGLFSSYNGVYLGDPRLDPLMETLDNLGAMVFVHPVTPLQPPQLGLPTFLFEFPFDTTRAGVNLLYRNVFLRFPRIRWLMAHAGGTLPYLSYRTGLLRLNLDPGRSLFSDLYYDTALSSATPSMKALREITSVSHILFATDWPFSGLVYLTKLPGDPARELDDSFNGAERRKVDRDNALAQFPRLAARLARLG